MFPVIQLGPLALQAPGLIIILAIWIGLSASEKAARHKGLSADTLYNLVFISLSAGVIAARLSFIATHLNAFTENWLSVLALDPRLLDPWAGIGMAIVAALIIGQRDKLSLWPTLDTLTPFFAVMTIAVWLANLSAGTAFGTETSLPWGLELWGVMRHPTQVYGLIGALVALALVYRDLRLSDGKTFLRFVAFTAATTLIVEGFRADSILIGNIRIMQVVAWLAIAMTFHQLDKLTNTKSN